MSFREPIRQKNFSPLSRTSASNPLQRRRFKVPKPQEPIVNRSPEEQKAFLQQKLEKSAFVGYNGLNVPINVPQTSPPQPVQKQPASEALEPNIKQPEEPEVEATSEEEEETVQPKELSATASPNPESPNTEEKEEGVTANQQEEAGSTHPQSQIPNLQAQKEKASRLSSNWLTVPVKSPGTPSPPVQRKLSLGALEHQYQPQIGQRANSFLNGLNQFKAQQLAQDYSVQRQDSSGESQIEEPEATQPESLHNQQFASSPPDNPEDNTSSGSDDTPFNLQLQHNKEQKPPQQPIQSDAAIQAKCRECEQQEEQEEKDKSVQTQLTIGEPDDKYEPEADTMAAKVMAMPNSTLSQSVGRQTEAEKSPLAQSITPLVQRSASDTTQASPRIESRLASSQGGGNPLPENVRSFMEPRFGADFSPVRVHTDSTSVQMNKELGAQAFTHGSNIYYGGGKSPNVDELTAHELTHTIHQGAAMRLNKQVQRQTQEEEEEETLPAKELPVLQREVSRNKPVQPTQTLVAKTLPDSIAQASLNKEPSFKPEVTEAETEAQPIQAKAYTSLAVSSTSPRIQRGLFGIPTSIEEAKSAILSPVANLASSIPGYPLLKVVLGKDPIKGTPVERNATNLIQGVLSLVPKGKEFFANLQQSGAIDKAYTWFTQQIAKLNLTWAAIKGLFSKAWDSLGFTDLVSPSSAFAKIKNVFTEPIGRIKNFAIAAGKKVMEFVFEGVMGAGGAKVMAIIRRAGGVFSTIINDPVKFIGNLVGAVRGGFQQFSGNILSHLKTGLVGWLFGALAGAGLTLPAQFDLKGIFSLVMQVLGLTYQRLRGMLVKLIGEPKVAKLEKVFNFLKTVVTDGLGAAWQKITEFVGNLQEMVIGGIRSWVQNSVITAAITKLISMFNPAGAVIQAVTAIYNTVMFFIERGQQIAALAESVFSSIGSIAGGNIKAAANYVEQTMGRTLPVVISFLARLIGLGGISDHIKNVIKKIQAPIENAMKKVANFIVEKGKSFLGRGKGSNTADAEPEHDRKVQEGLDAIDTADRQHRQEGKIKKQDAQAVASITKRNHPIFKSITVIDGGKTWNYDYVIARSKITGGDKAEGSEDEDLSRAKTAFGKNSFSTQQLADLLKVNLRTAQRRTKKWTENPDLYGCYLIPGTRDQYTFDKDKAPSYTPQEGKHGSIYVVNPDTWEIRPGINIRDKFYKKKFTSKADVLKQADSGQETPTGEKLYHCQNTGHKGPNHKPLVTEQEAEVAHTEAVVEHWNKQGGGHDITQEERNKWYDDPNHLKIWCSSCNESDNQGVYIRQVGKNFRGPNDNPPD